MDFSTPTASSLKSTYPTQPSPNLGAFNDRGQIVGLFSDSSGFHHGFLYNDGNFTVFDVSGARFTEPHGINDAGQIVGGFLTTTVQGFAYNSGNITVLDISGSVETVANGINGRGQIVGYSEDNTGLFHGFLATPAPALAGSPGEVSRYSESVTTLARRYGGITSAASALGYSDLMTLETAIVKFCGG
jgi:probable HAF family extracellular repeat protein